MLSLPPGRMPPQAMQPMRPRGRNEATVASVAKVCRANLRHVAMDMFAGPEDQVAEQHEIFFKDLLALTQYPTESVLQGGFGCAFPEIPANVHATAAKHVKQLVMWLRNKKKTMTSGRKLPPAVLRLARQLGASPAPSPSPGKEDSPQTRGPSASTTVSNSFDAAATAARYGVAPPTPPRKAAAADCQSPGCALEVLSSQDVEYVCGLSPVAKKPARPRLETSGSAAASSTTPQLDARVYWDCGRMTLARLTPRGEELATEIRAGPDGFLLATFADGLEASTRA